jgi:hypothetical protein
MVTSIAFCAAARLGVRHGWQRVEVGLEQMLELRPLVTSPPGVLGTDIDREDFVRLEQSSECVLLRWRSISKRD